MADPNARFSSPQEIILKNEDYNAEDMKNLNEQRRTGQSGDFTLQIGTSKLSVHRVVLEASIPYFNSLFSSSLKEVDENTVHFNDMDMGMVESIMDYVYTGMTVLSYDQIKPFIELCDFFQMTELCKNAQRTLVPYIAYENCIDWYRFGKSFSLTVLPEYTMKYMCNNFMAMFFTPQLMDLSLSELIAILKSDEIQVESEDAVVEMCLKWLKVDESRFNYAEDVKKYLRIEYCTKTYLCHIFRVYKEREWFTPMLPMVSQRIVDIADNYPCQKSCNEPRKYNQALMTHIQQCVLTFTDIDGYVKRYTPDDKNNAWPRFYPSVSDAQWYDSQLVCQHEDGLIILGREVETECGDIDTVNRFVCWNTLEYKDFNLPSPVPNGYQAASVCVGDYLYVLGGKPKEQEESIATGWNATANKLNVVSKEWSTLASMPKAVPFPKAVAGGIHIYVVSTGISDDANCILDYNTVTNEWATVCGFPPEIKSTERMSLIFYNGELYLVGGVNKYCTKYNILTESWNIIQRPNHDILFGDAVVFNGKILLFDCGSGGQGTIAIEEYQEETNTWNVVDMKLEREYRSVNVFVVSNSFLK